MQNQPLSKLPTQKEQNKELLEQLTQEIAEDAKKRPESFLKDTEVKEGGE